MAQARVASFLRPSSVVFRAVAPLLGSRFAFPWLLQRSLAAAQRSASGFFLPTPFVERYFGGRLVVEIAPSRLRWRIPDRIAGERGERFLRDHFIGGGDWQALAVPVEASPAVAEIVELMERAVAPRQLRRYRRLLQRIEEGRPAQRNYVRLDSAARVEAYFAHCAALVDSIRRHGLLSREGLVRAGVEPRTDAQLRPSWLEASERDVGIAIDADGRLHQFGSGKHRTAIAQRLGLDRMPARVRLVHHRWLGRVMAATGLGAAESLVAGIEQLRAVGHGSSP